jgi:hypothetical protein
MKSTVRTSFDWTLSSRLVAIYDQNNDGFNNVAGSADYRDTITETEDGRSENKTETSTIQIPIGLELRTIKKFPIRLGVTHQIQSTKTTATTEINNPANRTTVTDENGGTVTSYDASGVRSISSTTQTTDIRTTQYYYGIGYEWSENLVFDVLGIAGGDSVFDLNDWRIGATFRF